METNKTLIIVESPTKAKNIGNMLPECTVIASQGHIRDLPSDKMGIDLETLSPEYVIPPEKTELVKEMKKLLQKADRLILATDEDREGESIARHLIDVLSPTVPTGRMVFHEITKKAILEAFENTREINKDMVDAQEARRVLDRLFGYSISPLLWSKLSVSKLSAGRVQSPTLKLLVERELERMKYTKSSYFTIKASFAKDKNKAFGALLEEYNGKKCVTNKEFYDEITGELKKLENVIVLDEKQAKSIEKELEDASYSIVDIKEKEITKQAPPPFITSTLQQDANTKLHYSTKDTMRLAQNLYEKGFITYMRTDSPTLSLDGMKAARVSVEKEYGAQYLSSESRNFVSKDKNAQEAHEAIRPAIIDGLFVHPDETKLTNREKNLYSLIYRRTVASQMKPSKKLSTIVHIAADTSNKAIFTSKGIKIEFPGYLKAYDKDEDQEDILPNLNKGDDVDLITLECSSQETGPRARFTEAGLIKKMEELGIGRPSTYATTVTSLISKQYVERVQNALSPTFLGVVLCEFLDKYFTKYVDYDFTSNMEKSLDDIAKHQIDSHKYLEKFYKGKEGLESIVDERNSSIKASDAKKITLPGIDSSKYDIRYGKFGPYIQKEIGEYKGLPNEWLPGDVTPEKLDELINDKRSGAEIRADKFTLVGESKIFAKKIYYAEEGKFGPYWVLGSVKDKESVKFYSVPRGTKAEDWSLEEIESLFSLPRKVGIFEPTGDDIVASIGKFGPYISYKKEYRSLPNAKAVLTITEEEANAILKEEKPEKKRGPRAKKA